VIASPSARSPVPVILDCDPGHDDVLAILLAARHPGIDLLLVTTVAGNRTVEDATSNARKALALAGAGSTPVAQGASRPLVEPLRTADGIHGQTALDDDDLGLGTVPLATDPAVTVTAALLRDAAAPITIVAIGPLTNLALLLREHPEVCGRIREVVVMGGSSGRGNVDPLAEFNVRTDPEAAQVVFSSGLPVTMCGLDVTHQALVTDAVLDRFAAVDGPAGRAAHRVLEYFVAGYESVYGVGDPPLHDPIAVARVIDPSLLECRSVNVVVELTGRHTRGATVCDLRQVTGRPENVDFAVALAVDRFWDLLVEAIQERRPNLGGL
jgi:purine nucleosidase